MKRKHAIFAAIPSIVVAVILAAVWYRYEPLKSAEQRGKDLNQQAWEASFTERGLPIPEGGPRDSYWSSRLSQKRVDRHTTWRELPQHIPGILEIAEDGSQSWTSGREPKRRILILGGSVAFGVYASSIDATYFNQLGRSLEADGIPVFIKVVATGAWKARNELPALDAESGPWDLVIFLDGVNDLTLDHPNEPFGPHDIEGRVNSYLAQLRRAAEICRERGWRFLVVLQPSLIECKIPTDLERQLLTASFKHDPEQLPLIRRVDLPKRLAEARDTGEFHFFNASRIFDHETATTFSDNCHFSDPGQAILGKALAVEVERMLTE
jgi:lysophospholipase L1-like esterase